MKKNILLLNVFLLSNLTACDFIKRQFPDKEKDYRFTYEIPPLEIPEELKKPVESKKLVKAPEMDALPKLDENGVVVTPDKPNPIVAFPLEAKASKPTENEASKSAELAPLPPDDLVTKDSAEQALLQKNFAQDMDDSEKAAVTEVNIDSHSSGQMTLRINQNLARSWRIVGKAISRKNMEISERNLTGHYFEIHYDPEAKAMEDSSFWDDMRFIFGKENNQEQIYRVLLNETGNDTYIHVKPKDADDCTSDKCQKFFALLHESIQQSLSEAAQPKAAPEKTSE